MLKDALEILKSECSEGPLGVGVSGGADSMCLIHLVLNCGFIDKSRVTVLHVDHGLRATSGRDAKLVADYCDKNGIGFEIFEPDILSAAKENKRSIETEARLARRGFFQAFCEKNGALLLLGHNRDDQAETILMHIFRGCGLDGLVGMRPRDGNIVRPLLGAGKEEILAFADRYGVQYCEDETNSDETYTRNFIRNLIPRIEKKYPGVREGLMRLSALTEGAVDYIYSSLKPEWIKKAQDGAILLDKRALSDPLAAYYVIRAAKQAGLTADLESKHIEAILALGDAEETGGKLNLPRGLVVFNERETVEFCFWQPQAGFETAFAAGNIKAGGVTVCIVPFAPKVLKGVIIADADKLSGAVVRFRQTGDSFCPCGGKRKKLKTYLNEKHVPNRLKGRTPLICRGDEVLVVCGIELSDSVKITPETKNACLITVQWDSTEA